MIRRFKRGIAPYVLVLLQVHLLCIIMFHRHNETTVPWHIHCIHVGGSQQSPSVESSVLCTACQIVRNSAIRPATVVPLLSAALMVALPQGAAASQYHSPRPAIWYGRAPPVL
jgi:peptidoglycan/LPS O-acetylase OafA/YrhL